MNVKETYAKRKEDIQAQIKKLQELLDKETNENPNWADTGTLGHIEDVLHNAIQSWGGH